MSSDNHTTLFVAEKVRIAIGGVYLTKDLEWLEWDADNPIDERKRMASDELLRAITLNPELAELATVRIVA